MQNAYVHTAFQDSIFNLLKLSTPNDKAEEKENI